jgi:nitronate monooxygenase
MPLKKKLPDLYIGDLKINPPIIQGGMGVKISTASLVSAVCNEGAFGVIASVGLGEDYNEGKSKKENFNDRSRLALEEQLDETFKRTNRPFGVNIMCALSNYDDLVDACIKKNVAAIISGAGLPLKLPALVKNHKIKLIPIVSSDRAAKIICEGWFKRYNRIPDAIVVEGPLAGGHLGFNISELENINDFNLEKLISEVLEVAKKFDNIPVIAAGGIFDGYDIRKFLNMGASGVQIATRFICTHECDVPLNLKELFINCSEEDIIIIKSPVGLPARVIKNKFIEKVLNGEKFPLSCPLKCLKTCDPDVVPYCIAKALVNAYRGNLDEGFVMCGTNAHRIDKIVSVKELLHELCEQASENVEHEFPEVMTN